MTDTVNEYDVGCKYSEDFFVKPSMCGGDSLLSIPAALDVFQDTATFHADHFDIGPEGMNRRNYFWIITKTRIHINRLPEMMEHVTSNTWIQAAERASCERDYSITKGDEILVYGRSIWAVISRDTSKLVHMAGLYPEIEFDAAPPDDRSFARISKKFDDAEEIGQYTVRSVDIDLGGHMNNVNYVRAMLGCFTTEKIADLKISEIEVNFISQTYEGQTLTFKCRETDEGLEIGAIGPEGKTAFAAIIRQDRIAEE